MQCKRCRDCGDMKDSLVDFTGLSKDCLDQAFNITLPPAFQFLGAEKPDPKDKENKRKRKGDSNEDKAASVVNTDQEEAFKMKDSEDWKNNFVGKLSGDVPFWDKEKRSPNDCRMCKRFHIRGICFKEFSNAASHVAKGYIPSNRREAMKGYMTKVRRS